MSDRESQSPPGRRYNRRQSHHPHGGTAALNFDEDSRRSPEVAEKILFERFENVASSVTKLYNAATWPMFQQAAAAITVFYKDSVDSHRRGFDAGVSLGRQMLGKELLAALQKSSGHPYVRRDDCVDLILRLASSSATLSPSIVGAAVAASSSTRSSSDDWSPSNAQRTSLSPESSMVAAGNLEMFREALAAPPGLTAFFAEECRRHSNKRRRDEMDDDSSPANFWVKKRNRRN